MSCTEDFGSRIYELEAKSLQRLLALKPIISLDRQEAAYFGEQVGDNFAY